jgi:hypothetical protein
MSKLREYYDNYREALDTIDKDFVVLISRVTNDGGKAGVLSEASRDVAAHRIAGNSSFLANEEDTQRYYDQAIEARESAQREASKDKIKFAVLSSDDFRKIDNSPGKKK